MKKITTSLQSHTRRILPLLTSLTLLFNVAFGQAPVTEEEAKDFEQEFNYLLQLSREGENLVGSQDSASRESGKAKLQEVIELSQRLFKKLDDNDELGKKAGPTIENAKVEFQLLLRQIEIGAYRDMGSYYYSLTDWQRFIEYNESALQLIRKTASGSEFASSKNFPQTRYNLRISEMGTLSSISSTLLYKLDKPGEALGVAEEAIQVARQIQREEKDEKTVTFARYAEAQVWNQMAQIHSNLNDRLKSIDCSKQALQIYQSLPDQRDDVIGALHSIGLAYFNILDYENALKYLNEALRSSEEIGNKYHQSLTLSMIGNIYYTLGNEQKEKEVYKRRLEIVSSPDYLEFLKNRERSIPIPVEGFKNSGTSSGLADDNDFWRYAEIGVTYLGLKEYDKSVEYNNKALQLVGALNLPPMKRAILALIARAYREKEDWQNALIYYRQASEISLALSDKSVLGIDLANLGFVNFKLKKWQDALPNATQALLTFQSLSANKDNIDTGYAYALDILSQIHNELGDRRLAIFYGKQAVNAIQRERLQLKNLDQKSQLGYLKKNEKPYRRLADWLIEEGRFAQAEQVLRMLKEEEYSDFVRRDSDEIKNLNERVTLNGKEKELIERYTLLADRVTEMGQKYSQLDDKKGLLSRKQLKLSDEEENLHKEYSAQLKDANGAFKLFIEKVLVAELGEVKAEGIEIDRRMQEKLRRWGKGTVALYTVVGEDRYRVVLTTPTAQIDGKFEIKAADLNKKIFAFRDALQNPKADPRPLGKALYDILIKPIEKDLRATSAKTLVWSLDGTLRYIPLAALSPDGKSYLAEKYQNVVITPKTRDDLSTPNTNWRALGLGVSRGETVSDPDDPEKKNRITFQGLPGTKRELAAIVRDEQAKEETGVLMGKRLLDERFTVESLIESLREETEEGEPKYTVNHFASHFRLGSKWSNSFLLLGSGKILTLEEISDSPNIRFGNAELITLSACNTAFADESNGKEVDSLAEVIQTKGGKAILATLWSVADESTAVLMSEFYRLKKENPKLTKAEALQRAQRTLINGRYRAGETPFWRGPAVAESDGNSSPSFTRDDKAPYAHPYFWSPFVLIGNWR